MAFDTFNFVQFDELTFDSHLDIPYKSYTLARLAIRSMIDARLSDQMYAADPTARQLLFKRLICQATNPSQSSFAFEIDGLLMREEGLSYPRSPSDNLASSLKHWPNLDGLRLLALKCSNGMI